MFSNEHLPITVKQPWSVISCGRDINKWINEVAKKRLLLGTGWIILDHWQYSRTHVEDSLNNGNHGGHVLLLEKELNNILWLAQWVIMNAPYAADQWCWSFNSANVATVEVFTKWISDSNTKHTSHTHSFSSISLFFCLIHMLKMSHDSYRNYSSPLIKLYIHSLQDSLLSLVLFQSACQCFSKTQNHLLFSFSTSFYCLYPVSTFLLLAFLLFSIVLHLSLSACISHFTLNMFNGSINYYHDCVSMFVCCRYD